MKKPVTLIAFLCFQMMFWAQLVPTKVKALETKKIIKTEVGKKDKDDAAKDQLVSYEFSLNSIAIAEASRNTIDNNDCRSTWGSVRIRFYELDANGQIDFSKRITADLDEESFFEKVIGRNAPFRAKSFYQDRIGISNDEYIKRISVRVSENMVRNRRIVASVEAQLRTAHKDNDFATYDILRMISSASTVFYLEDLPTKEESMSVVTTGHSSIVPVRGGGEQELSGGGNSDDTHRIWLHFTIKKKQ